MTYINEVFDILNGFFIIYLISNLIFSEKVKSKNRIKINLIQNVFELDGITWDYNFKLNQ